MGSDSMGHGFHFLRGLASQDPPGEGRAGLGVVGVFVQSPVTGGVVKQGSGTDDLQVGALGLSQVLGQGQDPEDVIKVVNSISALVVLLCLFNSDHGLSAALT
jgi:hypothetical protein